MHVLIYVVSIRLLARATSRVLHIYNIMTIILIDKDL